MAPSSLGVSNTPKVTRSGLQVDLSGFENLMETFPRVLEMGRHEKTCEVQVPRLLSIQDIAPMTVCCPFGCPGVY